MALVGNAVRPGRGRAFTLAELLVALFVLALILFVVALLTQRGHGRDRGVKCGTQVRNVIQAMTIFAQGNKDSYPVPQNLDVNNQTVAAGTAGDASTQWGKNNTSNVLSILIFNSSISPELCVSPSESSSLFKVDDAYQSANPLAAAVPANAVWDPGFCAFPGEPVGGGNRRDTKTGNCSYASLVFNTGNRMSGWSNTFNATEAVFGNRGASYGQTDALPWTSTWKLMPGLLGTQSNTLAIHGGRTTWEGYIGYNDNHVNFETCPDPAEITFTRANGTPRVVPDNFFVDETDENADAATRGNAYLRPFATVQKVTGQPESQPEINVFRD